jgi:hypothetical protein
MLIIALLLSNNKRCEFDFKEIAYGADIFIIPVGSRCFLQLFNEFFMINTKLVILRTLMVSIGFLSGHSLSSTASYTDDLIAEAEAGDAAAQFSLGFMFYSGQGISKSIDKAVHWYAQAAERGLSEAQFRIGALYDYGKEISEDNSQAFKWYKEASLQGHAESQAMLGKMYFNGEGVAQSDVNAFLWWTLARTQGSNQAKIFVRETTGVIRRHQIIEARALASRCYQSQYKDCNW